MIDTYIKSTDKAALETFCEGFQNAIGLNQGRASHTDEDGVEYGAIGDPAYWYTCIRSYAEITLPDGIELCDTQEGIDVCGLWS